jgi:hypothetical protein
LRHGGRRPSIAATDLRAFVAGFRYLALRVAEPTPTSRARTKVVLAFGERTVLTRTHWQCLLAISAVALLLRLFALGEWSLWIDEAHTWRDATMPLFSAPRVDGFLDSNRQFYPLTFLWLRGLLALGWGQDEVSLRLPFVVVGAATVPLLGLCGRHLVGATPAVLAAGVLAVDPWHVFWSQNARGYAIVVMMAVVVADRAFAYVRSDRLRDLMVVWAAVAVGALSHPTGVLLLLGVAAFLLLRARPLVGRRLVHLGVGAVLAVAALPWAIDYLPFEGFMLSNDSPSLLHFLQTTGFYFRPVVLLLAAVGLWQLRAFGGRDRSLALGSLLFTPFVVLMVIGACRVLTTARYAICALPVVTWLAAFAVAHVAAAIGRATSRTARLPRLLAVGALPLLLVAEHTVGLVDYYTVQHGQRARWREAATFLQERAAGRPLRVSTINHPTMLYYLRPGQWEFRVPTQYAKNTVVPLIDWMVLEGLDEFKVKQHEPGASNHLDWHRQAARATGALFAFVVTLPELVEQDPTGRLKATITQECELVLHLPCWVGPKDESIYVYVLKEP